MDNFEHVSLVRTKGWMPRFRPQRAVFTEKVQGNQVGVIRVYTGINGSIGGYHMTPVGARL